MTQECPHGEKPPVESTSFLNPALGPGPNGPRQEPGHMSWVSTLAKVPLNNMRQPAILKPNGVSLSRFTDNIWSVQQLLFLTIQVA